MASVQGLYLAIFGRPADPEGLAFHQTLFDRGSIGELIGHFSASDEFAKRFDGLSAEDLVASIYQSLFNREPDAEGLSYFIAELNSGRQTIETIAVNIMDGAQGTDVDTLAAKLAASDLFTAQLDTDAERVAYRGGLEFQGDHASDVARAFVQDVDAANPATAQDAAEAILRLFPSVSVTLGSASVAAGGSTLVTFDFSEQVTGFDIGDVTVAGGVLGALRQSDDDPTVFTATLTAGRSSGPGSISVAAGGYQDRDGIAGLEDTLAFTVAAQPSDGSKPPTANAAPVALDDGSTSLPRFQVAPGADFTIELAEIFGNDTDADADTIALSSFGQPQNGSLTLEGSTLVYTPNDGFAGTDSFTYVITDGSLVSRPATVFLAVGNLADIVIDFDDIVEVSRNQPIETPYDFIGWDNFYLGGPLFQIYWGDETDGYANGLISGANLAFNVFGNPASFFSPSAFDFESAWLTAAWSDGMTVRATGFNGIDEVGFQDIVVSTDAAQQIFFDDAIFDSVTRVTFSIETPGDDPYNTHFAIDDIALIGVDVTAVFAS